MPLQHLSNSLHQTVQYWFAKEHLLDNASGYIIQGVVRGDEATEVCLTDLHLTVTCICSEFELAGLSMTSMWYSAWRCRSSRSSRPTLLTCRAQIVQIFYLQYSICSINYVDFTDIVDVVDNIDVGIRYSSQCRYYMMMILQI